MYFNSDAALSHQTATDLSSLTGMPIAALTPRHSIMIQVPGNEPSVWVGQSSVQANVNEGFQVASGDTMIFVMNAEHLYAIAENGTSNCRIFSTVG